VENLSVFVSCLTLRDLAELEPAENTTDIYLHWFECPYIKEVFPVLKRWRHLTRLTLSISKKSLNNIFPPFEVFSNFIMGMKHLQYLHINAASRFYDRSNDDQLEILRDKVNELILPRRPNFKFSIFRSDY
jgi:hypothetical protein